MQLVNKLKSKLANYPRLRVLLIVVVLIVIFIIGMNLFSSGDATNKPMAPPSSITPPPTPRQGQPVAPVQQQNYEALANRVQAAQTSQDISTGKTLFSNVFTVPGSTAANKNAAAKSGSAPTPIKANTNAKTSSEVINPEQAQQDEQKVNQVKQVPPTTVPVKQGMGVVQPNAYNGNYAVNNAMQSQAYQENLQQQQVNNLQQSMAAQIQTLQSSWKLPNQTTVQATTDTSSGSGGSSGTGAPTAPVAIKAGTIMFAVVNTALDSDQPGTPVMATIVAGPYTGALLLGTFNREQDKLVVQFGQMSLKNKPSTVGIGTAYAIDSQTANNAVATSADNHYLLRYGMLFASGFLQGFGGAYQNYQPTCSPGTQNCTIFNNGTPNPSVTSKQAMYQGFGQVGTNLSQVAAQQFNTAPTVKLAQGTGIGILFMNDVRIP